MAPWLRAHTGLAEDLSSVSKSPNREHGHPHTHAYSHKDTHICPYLKKNKNIFFKKAQYIFDIILNVKSTQKLYLSNISLNFKGLNIIINLDFNNGFYFLFFKYLEKSSKDTNKYMS